MSATTNIWSYTLTNDNIEILAANNVVRISILVREGTITIEGSATFNNIPSNAVTCQANQGLTLTASSVANPLDGITITAGTSGDIADIVLSYQ